MTPNRVWIFLGTLLLIGAPATYVLVLRTSADAGQAAFLTMVYLLAVGMLFFTGKIWQILQEHWATRLADRLDQQVMDSLTSFQRRYLRHIVESNRFFEVKGLSNQGIHALELDQVFVEPNVFPQVDHLAALDPLHTPSSEDPSASHSLRAILDSPQLADQSLMILGPPGSGKTTLLRHTALRMASGLVPDSKESWLPLLLYLHELAAVIEQIPTLSLTQAVGANLAQWGLTLPLHWFDERLAKGNCLVMLDGLDEVADPAARSLVVAWIQRQMERYSSSRFIVTSRPSGYQTPELDGVTVLGVAPFNRQQISAFIQNWYMATEIEAAQHDDLGVRADAQRGANDLIDQLHTSPERFDLAINPLLLTMIACVHRYNNQLPGGRVELYKEICEVLLSQRHVPRGLGMELTTSQKQRILQQLAYYLMTRQRRESSLKDALWLISEPLKRLNSVISAEAFLQEIASESGLFIEHRPGQYGFTHMIFQEYLASVQALELNLEGELAGRVESEWWHETIRLYCAQADASSIVAACLKVDPPSIPVLTLAIECAEEALELSPESRGQLEAILTRDAEDPDSLRRCFVAETLLAQRLRRLKRIEVGYFADLSLLTCAEYQLFLDDLGESAYQYTPDHWPEAHYPPGQARLPVLGVRPEDARAFCTWLTQRHGGDWEIHLPVGLFTFNRSNRIEHSDLLPPIAGQAGYWFQLIPETRSHEDAALLVYNRAALASYMEGNILTSFMSHNGPLPGLDFDARFLQQVTADLLRAMPSVHRLKDALRQAQRSANKLQTFLTNELPEGSVSEYGDQVTWDLIGSGEFIKDMIKALELAAEADPEISIPLLGYVERAQKATSSVESSREQCAIEIAGLHAGLQELEQRLAERGNDPDQRWADTLDLHLERDRILESALETVLHLQAQGELNPQVELAIREALEDVDTDPRLLYTNLATYVLKAFNVRAPAYLDIEGGRRKEQDVISASSKTAELTNYDDPMLIRDYLRARQIVTARKPIGPAVTPAPAAISGNLQAREFLRWYIRLYSLGLALRWLWAMPAASNNWRTRRTPEGQHALEKRQKCQEMVRLYLNRYCDFALLEWRIHGEAPAVEGIRIVKERIIK